jgi:hypothetical protein
VKRRVLRAPNVRAWVELWRQRAAGFGKSRIGFCVRRAPIAFLLIGVVFYPSLSKAASAISLAGIDFHKLCRETAHVPLVQAAVNPAYINVWSEQESRRAGRYEQYSFKTQRIDVRVEHDVSLYHGLIHRTLDLIGESQWKHRDFGPHEDQEHWLIYYTLETHWPGLQRAQGAEPSLSMLGFATDYWRLHGERYGEIADKATALAKKSWCAVNLPGLEVQQIRLPAVTPEKPVVARVVPVQPAPEPAPAPIARMSEPVMPSSTPAAAEVASLPPVAPPSLEAIEPPMPPAPQAAASPPQVQARVQQPSSPLKQALPNSLAVEPIWVMSEFLSVPPTPMSQRPSSDSVWSSSPDQSAPPVPQPVAQRPDAEQPPQPAAPWSPAQSIWATPAEREAAAALPTQASSAPTPSRTGSAGNRR